MLRRDARLLITMAICSLVSFASSCTDEGCPAEGSSDICAGDPYGYASVEGQALDGSNEPLIDKRVSVACGDVVGVYDGLTDEAGRFAIPLVYGSLPDSNLVPLPPRSPDGSFLVPWDVGVRVSSAVAFEQRAVPVRFFPERSAVVTTEVTLRLEPS